MKRFLLAIVTILSLSGTASALTVKGKVDLSGIGYGTDERFIVTISRHDTSPLTRLRFQFLEYDEHYCCGLYFFRKLADGYIKFTGTTMMLQLALKLAILAMVEDSELGLSGCRKTYALSDFRANCKMMTPALTHVSSFTT